MDQSFLKIKNKIENLPSFLGQEGVAAAAVLPCTVGGRFAPIDLHIVQAAGDGRLAATVPRALDIVGSLVQPRARRDAAAQIPAVFVVFQVLAS